MGIDMSPIFPIKSDGNNSSLDTKNIVVTVSRELRNTDLHDNLKENFSKQRRPLLGKAPGRRIKESKNLAENAGGGNENKNEKKNILKKHDRESEWYNYLLAKESDLESLHIKIQRVNEKIND